MSPRVRFHLAAVLSVALLHGALAAPAWADAPSAQSVTRATELKKKADGLMDDLKFAEAYQLYAEAYAITANPALLYNEGRALEATGDYPRALERLEQFVATAPPEVKALAPAVLELIIDVRARVSKLVVTCNVNGARVLVRDVALGIVDGTTELAARAGKATVDVLADGYEPFHTEVDLPGGGSLTVNVTLGLSREIALLHINAAPAGSLVDLDGKAMGPAPLEVKMTPGVHALLVTHAGYLTTKLPITLAAGEHRTLDLSLQTPPALYTKWWFWTGVGAVVVTGVIVAVALSTDKSNGSGTFSPGQVRGPLTLSF